MIDWINPSDDILEAKRIGYEEGYEKGKEEVLESAELLDPLAEIERLREQLRREVDEFNGGTTLAEAIDRAKQETGVMHTRRGDDEPTP